MGGVVRGSARRIHIPPLHTRPRPWVIRRAGPDEGPARDEPLAKDEEPDRRVLVDVLVGRGGSPDPLFVFIF